MGGRCAGGGPLSLYVDEGLGSPPLSLYRAVRIDWKVARVPSTALSIEQKPRI